MRVKTVRLTEQVYSEATKRLAKLPIFDGSHRKEEANQVGVLGEIVVENWLNDISILFHSELYKTTHDYVLADRVSTFEVKTKDRTVQPRGRYECSVPLYNHAHQVPTYYMFVSLERSRDDQRKSLDRFHTAYILGGLNQKQLHAYGKVWRAGETDEDNGTTFWTDCINVPIVKLTPLDLVVEKWRDIPLM